METIYYFKEYDLVKINKYLIDNEKIVCDIKEVIKYLESQKMSILNDNMYITYSNENINILKTINFGRQITLLTYDGEDIKESDCYKETIKSNNVSNSESETLIKALIRNALNFSLFTYCLLKDDNFENNKRSSKNYKVINTTDYTQVKFKKLSVEIKIYDKIKGLCKYEVNDNTVKIISNTLIQDIKTVPSNLYPLPNKDFKIFTSENTSDLKDDKVSELLSDLEIMIGGCYTNSTNITKILKDNNINAKFYSGWLLRLNKMIHHAWVVIDDNHLIDVSILKKEDDIIDLEFLNNPKPNNPNLIETLSKLIEEKIPFKDKYYYGKVSRYSAIYIGSETTPMEARKSFNDLIRAIPNHPDYQNVDENGVNQTQRALYKKIHGIDI